MPDRFSTNLDADVSPLRQPLAFPFSGRVAKNRLMKAAMSERICTWVHGDPDASGLPNKEMSTLYRHWSHGGFGVVVTGHILVDPSHIEGPGNAIVPIGAPFSGPRFEAYKDLAAAGKEGGSLFLGQLNHPGRQTAAMIQPNPVSASDIPMAEQHFGIAWNKPHAASQSEIRAIVSAFVHSATYLEAAGFDGVELHGAHGYLLAQFLSQATNVRTDQYGGSLENRARIITEIADGIRAATGPTFVLGIKINSVEFQERGFTAEEAGELCTVLEAHRFDFVELSGGTYDDGVWTKRRKRDTTVKREAFFVEFAEKITPRLEQTKSYVTGGIRTVGAMLDALQSVDGVAFGRPSCTEPRLANEILSGRAKASIKPLVDEMDYSITFVLAQGQLSLISRDREPMDSSDQILMDGFLEDLNEARKQSPPTRVNIRSQEDVPYGQQGRRGQLLDPV
ncbi:FMN-linked oxidoreductase [Thozetella sp. PMI_491]|nr:FMN-linked oxidoreductase [Thozetella sp. PMI_491]